jgi:hypothetical protein
VSCQTWRLRTGHGARRARPGGRGQGDERGCSRLTRVTGEVCGEGMGKGAVGRLAGRTSTRRTPGVRCWFASRAVSRPAYRGRGAARHSAWEVPGG